MRYSHRFFLYAPIGAFAIVAIAASVHWWMAANAFSRRLDALNGQALMPGVTLHFASKRISGFPFRLDAVFKHFGITIAATRGPITWSSDNFAVHRLTDSYDKEIFEAAGQQKITWTGRSGKKQNTAFLPARLRASSISGAKGLARFDLELFGASGPDFALETLQFHMRRDPAKQVLDFAANMDGLKLAHATRYGDTLKRLDLTGTIGPVASLLALLDGETRWQTAADTWRAAHGRITINAGSLRWNKATLSVKGTIALDSRKKPAGDLHVTANGTPVQVPLGKAALY